MFRFLLNFTDSRYYTGTDLPWTLAQLTAVWLITMTPTSASLLSCPQLMLSN